MTVHVHAGQGPAQVAPGVPAAKCGEAGADAGAAAAASGGAVARMALLLREPAVPGMRPTALLSVWIYTPSFVVLAALYCCLLYMLCTSSNARHCAESCLAFCHHLFLGF